MYVCVEGYVSDRSLLRKWEGLKMTSWSFVRVHGGNLCYPEIVQNRGSNVNESASLDTRSHDEQEVPAGAQIKALKGAVILLSNDLKKPPFLIHASHACHRQASKFLKEEMA